MNWEKVIAELKRQSLDETPYRGASTRIPCVFAYVLAKALEAGLEQAGGGSGSGPGSAGRAAP